MSVQDVLNCIACYQSTKQHLLTNKQAVKQQLELFLFALTVLSVSGISMFQSFTLLVGRQKGHPPCKNTLQQTLIVTTEAQVIIHV